MSQYIAMEYGVTNSKEELVADDGSETMNNFFEQMGAIKMEIQRIKNRVQILKRFHQQIEKCSVDNVRQELEKKVEEEKEIILMSAANTRATLKSVQELFMTKRVSPAMMRMNDVQMNSQMKMLSETMEEYLECLTSHRDRSVQLLKDMIQVKNEHEDEAQDLDDLLEKGKTAFFVNNLLIDTLEERVSEVEDRHQEIIKVEKSIREVRDLFTELAFAVNIQGEMIIGLDKHVTKSLKKVGKAKTDVVTAKKKANTGRKRKVILATVCILVVAVLLLILLLL